VIVRSRPACKSPRAKIRVAGKCNSQITTCTDKRVRSSACRSLLGESRWAQSQVAGGPDRAAVVIVAAEIVALAVASVRGDDLRLLADVLESGAAQSQAVRSLNRVGV